jgi:hypothetical protein
MTFPTAVDGWIAVNRSETGLFRSPQFGHRITSVHESRLASGVLSDRGGWRRPISPPHEGAPFVHAIRCIWCRSRLCTFACRNTFTDWLGQMNGLRSAACSCSRT